MSNLNNPYFSIVVCVYNATKIKTNNEFTVLLCLKSLISQTYNSSSYEILVIDDESTDNSFDLILSYLNKDLKTDVSLNYFKISHGGLSVARNFGIKSSKGNVIVFIDQDAVADKNWLSGFSKPFRLGADFSGGMIKLLNTESKLSRFLQQTRYRQFFGPKIYQNQFVGCNMAIKKKVFDNLGGFHENFTSYGDESTFFERAYYNFKYLPAVDAVVSHKQPDSFSVFYNITKKSSSLYYLTKLASGKKITIREIILIAEQSLILVFLLNWFVIYFNTYIFKIILAISLPAVIRRLFFHPLNKRLLKGLMQNYGKFRGLFSYVAYVFFMDVIGVKGKILSPFKFWNSKIIPPMTSKPRILFHFSNNTSNKPA